MASAIINSAGFLRMITNNLLRGLGAIHPEKQTLRLLTMLFLLAPYVVLVCSAKTIEISSPFSPPEQQQLRKAVGYFKSGNAGIDKGMPLINSLLQSADSVSKCLAIADSTEASGFPALEARRECVKKAISLCRSSQDYMDVIHKSRQYQFFEITRLAINSLVDTAKTPEQLYELAARAQAASLSDVAHMALEKAFSSIRTVEEALKFAHDAKAMGMEDLARKAAKDLIDDESNAHQLCTLLTGLTPLGMSDTNRYCLKKALDKALIVEEFAEIKESASRLGEPDIYKVAEYRARKLRIINRMKEERDEYQKQMQAEQTGEPAPTQTPGGF